MLKWLRGIYIAVCILILNSQCIMGDDLWSPNITPSTFTNVGNILQFEDTSKVLLNGIDGVFLSDDSGKNWNKLDFKDDDGVDLNVISIQEFEYFPNVAMVFTGTNRQFYTFDQGITWNFFDLPIESTVFKAKAQINYANKNYMLFEFTYVKDNTVLQSTFYSIDGLDTPPNDIDIDDTGDCTFTKINPYFSGDDANIVCIRREYNVFNILTSDKIIKTNDFFKTITVSEDGGLENSHVLSINVVKSFVALVVSTDRYLIDSTVLYVSKDGINFFKASFEDQRKGWMFNILDSTNDALYVSVFGSNSMKGMTTSSDIYRSDSTGRNFKKIFGDVFSNILGMSFISKVQTLDGVWIASHNDEYNGMELPKSKTMITYDDGENWTYLNITDSNNCNNDDECSMHIAWLTQRAGDGELVTGETPGILVGIGNVGKYLEHKFDELKTFVSRDGGLSWKKVSDKPSVFAYGDLGNLIVTIPIDMQYYLDGNIDNAADYFSYSLDQGETWTEVKLNDKVIPLFFVNNKDNTDKAFILYAKDILNDGIILYSIDFDGAFTKTCGDLDMEEWFARVDPITKDQVCVYGHSEKFNRRKIDAKCFVNKNYDDLKVIEKPCICTIEDTECNYGFSADEDGNCQPVLSMLAQYCEPSANTLKLSSRGRIPGNLCEGGYKPPVNDYTLKCKDANEEKEKDAINVKFTSFGENIMYYQYLNKNLTSSVRQEETLIVITASRKAFISFNTEENFSLISDENFIYIFTNPYWPDSVYLISDTGSIYSSLDRGRTFSGVVSPYVSPGYSSYGMAFDAKDPSTYILFSNINCDSLNNCEVYSSITETNGEKFTDLVDNTNKCIFSESVFDSTNYNFPDTQIICSQKVNGESYYRLISTTDSFNSEPLVLFDKIVGFTTSGKYLVVAQLNDDDTLSAFVTLNGQNFAEVQFPHDINVEKQTAYTILDVNSDQLFIHLTTHDIPNREFGALLKANYNGTLFTTSIDYVNRNEDAYVDFESVQSLEGLSIVNVVMNPEEVKKGDEKKLVTKISHNDAATWLLIPAPLKDSEGKRINCKGCSLHLHSYTERLDPARDSFSSASALGMLFGLGNVGTSLSAFTDDKNIGLYFSKDAGITWREIAKGHYIWEFGDQGTVLVIVETLVEVDTLKYSLDLGETWNEYQFTTDKKYLVEDIATVPSDNSLKFILIVKDEDTSNSIFSIDFTNVYSRQCDLPFDTKESIGDDYEYFTPKHPSLKSSCLFGHETKYLRRKADKQCFIGMAPLYLGSTIVNNCECTREDYECDYNYALSIDGTCKLVKGLESLRGDEVCLKDNVAEWWEPTGYRKLTLSTCEGGLLLDKWNPHPCPGKELEKPKVGGWAMFWVIFIPFLAFAVALIIVYERGIKRNGGFSRLGEIRLDEDDNLQLIENNGIDKVINTVIKFGVFSFQLMTKFWRFGSKAYERFSMRNSNVTSGSMGAFFNDMVDDDDDHSLFGDLNDDEDAREIDSFLQHGDDFDGFITHDNGDFHDSPHDMSASLDAEAANSDFRLSDTENDF